MKPTFGQVFAFSLVGLIVILALLFQLVSSSSRETITRSSERIRNQVSSVISERITQFLNEAPATTWQFQREVEQGLLDPHDGHSVEPALVSLLLADSDLGELTFTYGDEQGFDANGDVKLAAEPRGQWSVIRLSEDRERCRHVYQEHGAFVADRRDLGAKTAFASVPWVRETGGNLPDPTTHLTFTTPARQDFHGRPVWSDLHWSQLDADLPEAQRRVEVSVQQAITDADGRFIGVLRAGLLARHLDEKIHPPNQANGQRDPHLTFICDEDGRLITGLAPTDHLREDGDDLRIAPEGLSAEIRAAVHNAILKEAVASETSVSGTFRANGEEYIATFRALPRPQTQDWVIGIVVPRAFYFGQLAAMRERLLAVLLGVMILLVICGGLILQGVRRAQAQITHESLKMNAFDFTPAPPNSPFRDVIDVLESQEKAKAAMRAMSKYVPIDLVRRLYREKSEPMLGAEPLEVSIMFTDIKDFTTLCERLQPNELADALGRYLEVMAGIIQRECGGTIDKFIGDAIMTFWNAPEPVVDHARMACRAALRCREAGARLAQSADWGTWPAFGTRFGLHCAPALIGHFGARDRMNYTAIGDAVNLASRLEGLNKQYGTSIIVSETVVNHCGDDFVFRLLDRVAVKGKSEAIRIFELLGVKGEAGELRETVALYEKAFAAYSTRDFAGAIEILSGQQSDPPSAALLGRCRGYLEEPPAEGWDGVYVSKTK
ncbi:adenylate cyclase [Chthoniobacter flavus]|uniref:adenylate/guanylate cyclase domain-containing protein n=1 Tax=Chthoniobacter flavus TaxID=191863 RepID=UPI0010DB37B5|nr:adenylate/guanylate cyclase domain-containing protein [Chthoniobacter flavus]TCO89396.1 adenylate cyclase [Chthoniobacter flavus]